MAWHHDRDRVRAQRVAGRARGPRRARRFGHLAVGGDRAERDASRGPQHALREAVHQRPVERQVEAPAIAGEVLVQLTAGRIGATGSAGRAGRPAPPAPPAPRRLGSLAYATRTRPRGVTTTISSPTGESDRSRRRRRQRRPSSARCRKLRRQAPRVELAAQRAGAAAARCRSSVYLLPQPPQAGADVLASRLLADAHPLADGAVGESNTNRWTTAARCLAGSARTCSHRPSSGSSWAGWLGLGRLAARPARR